MTNKYPQLTKCIMIMAEDSYGSLAGNFVLPQSEWRWTDNAPQLEAEASKLTDAELETFVCGDMLEVQGLVDQHDLQNLNAFINEVFDGDLHYTFYR